MVTDPVRQIEEQHYDSPFVADLPATLSRLAALPPSFDAPYLTLSLDWQADGTRPNRRPGREFYDQNAPEFLAGFAAHTPEHESLAADLERITALLDGEVDPAVQGLVVVACSANGVFEPVLLGMPVPSRIVTGPTPALRVLAKLAEDEPTFAVLVADQREATLMVIDQATRRQSVAVESTDFPRKQAQGGWSQRRYQQRADERVEAFARTVAEETQRAMDEAAIGHLVLAGDEQIATTLTDALHPTVQERVVGSIRMDVRATPTGVIAASLPVVEQAEREQEAAAVGRVENGAGPGGGAVTGPEETLTALQTGQVMALIVNDDFAAPGWADYTFPVYGVGDPPSQHPAGGEAANIVPVALEEELVRLALQTGAEIEFVRGTPPVAADEQPGAPLSEGGMPRSDAARALDAFGGVGALLRYALDEDQSTAEL